MKIIGDGEDRAKLEDFIRSKKLTQSVELIGKTDNVCKYYQEAEIFCLSSRFEGFPMVLLEALAFGIPVVSFDCETGPAEILDNTGSILVAPNDTHQLSKSLIELMNDSQQRESIIKKVKSKLKIINLKKYLINGLICWKAFNS